MHPRCLSGGGGLGDGGAGTEFALLTLLDVHGAAQALELLASEKAVSCCLFQSALMKGGDVQIMVVEAEMYVCTGKGGGETRRKLQVERVRELDGRLDRKSTRLNSSHWE